MYRNWEFPPPPLNPMDRVFRLLSLRCERSETVFLHRLRREGKLGLLASRLIIDFKLYLAMVTHTHTHTKQSSHKEVSTTCPKSLYISSMRACESNLRRLRSASIIVSSET